MDREAHSRSTSDVPVAAADTAVAVGVQSGVDIYVRVVLGATQLALVATVADLLRGHGDLCTARYSRSARCLSTAFLVLGRIITPWRDTGTVSSAASATGSW